MVAISDQEEEQPVLPRNGGHTDTTKLDVCVTLFASMILVALVLVFFFAIIFILLSPILHDPAAYSMGIIAVSGLDPTTNRSASALLDPEFNLTVRVASSSLNVPWPWFGDDCLDPSTSVEVSYLRVPLAGARAPRNVCTRAWHSPKDRSFVARGRGVAVPGFLVESLAEDMRRGEAVFEITLMTPHGQGWVVLTCWAKVGDASSTLETPCAKSSVNAGLPMVQSAGDSGYVPRPQVHNR